MRWRDKLSQLKAEQIAWLEKLQREGSRVRMLENRPEVLPDLLPYFQHYNALCLLRQGELEPQRLSTPEVLAYCELAGLPAGVWPVFLEVVIFCETESFKLLRQKRERAQAAKDAAPNA